MLIRSSVCAQKLYCYPEEPENKAYLLKHFEGYIIGKLYCDYEYTFLDL
jgi:cell cycle serine/threonine-protein kinase CDC5/MSD2